MTSSHGIGLWFSPDSQYLAFLQINNSLVGTYKYPWYGDSNNGDFSDFRYPEILEVKYPKVSVTQDPELIAMS